MKAALTVAAATLFWLQGIPALCQNAISPQNQQELAAMERKFFEHDFSKESLDYRVQRLEKFAFGQCQSGPIDPRIDRLAGVIDTHRNLVPPAPSLIPQQHTTDDVGDTPDGGANYPHITTLEKEILGKTFESDSLRDRLSRMEVKAFGQADSANGDPASRTDRLEQYATSKLHKRPFDSDRETADSSNSSGQWVPYKPARRITEPMSSIVSSLLGLPQYQEPESEPVAAPTPVPTDPAIYSQIPPDHHARMLTRVAWCEQHLFGKTFPSLHLTERLHQLNSELFPNDHEPDLQLMDRLDVIVKQVVLSQHPPIAYQQ